MCFCIHTFLHIRLSFLRQKPTLNSNSSFSPTCAVAWCAVAWCAVVCCGVLWCAVVCCGVLWCAVVCCGVLWCAVVCCGVLWCGVSHLAYQGSAEDLRQSIDQALRLHHGYRQYLDTTAVSMVAD